MDPEVRRLELNKITERIIGNTLGNGFLEKVYENALVHELRKAGLSVCLLINFGQSKVQIKRAVKNF